MRTLTFEQITDSRFDTNIEQLLAKRIEKIVSLLRTMDGVHVFHDGISKLTFEGPENNEQYRCRFWVRKDNRKTTWNDIYKVINSVKSVPYKFVEYDWRDINSNCL